MSMINMLSNIHVKFNCILYMSIISLLGIIIFIISYTRKLKVFKGHICFHVVKVMLPIPDAQYYVEIMYNM